jgi:serine/threonine protein kinase
MSVLSERYEVLGLLASGGMASVLYGRLRGPAGFQREVAIKRLHPHLARDPGFLQMFIDEAHICARLSHSNIVSAIDVIETPPDLCLVMEYVPGCGLDVLLQASRARGADVPLRIASALLTNVLHGLHAAHETRDDHGEPLGIVHRDVSPSNVLVGEDGVARVLDFGIARARSQLRTTPGSELKGKFSYMAPELLRGDEFDRRLDLYAAAVVLWEVLAGRPLYGGQPNTAIMRQVLEADPEPPSRHRAGIPDALDQLVLRGLAREPSARCASARELAAALERECGVASQHEVSEWMQGLVGDLLSRRASDLRRLSRERPCDPSTLAKQRHGRATWARRHPEQQTHIEPAQVTARAESATHSLSPPMRLRRPLLAIVLTSVLVLLGLVYARVQMTPTKTRASAPAAALAPVPSAERARPLALRTGELAPAPEPVAQPPAAEPPRAVSHPSPAREARVKNERPSTKPARARPAPDPCSNALQLELVDGVVVKTYKAECLK